MEELSTLLSQLRELARRGRWQECAALGRQAAAQYPGQAEVFFRLGLALINLRENDAAIAALWRTVQLAPNPPHYFHLGNALAIAGRHADAQAAYVAALRRDHQARRWMHPGYVEELRRVFYRAQARVDGHTAAILGQSALFPPGTTPKAADDSIRRNLESWRTAWEKGELPPPRNCERTREMGVDVKSMRGAKVMFVSASNVYASEEYIESQMVYDFMTTGRRLGLEMSFVSSNAFAEIPTGVGFPPRTPAMLQQAFDEFTRQIDHHRPDLIIGDGTYMAGPNTLSPDHWRKLRAEWGFKLILNIADSDDSHPNYIKAWTGVADRLMHWHPVSEHARLCKERDKLIYLPFLPADAEIFEYQGPKETDFAFVGSHDRERDVYLVYITESLAAAGRKWQVILHNREKAKAPPIREWAQIYARTRLTCSLGFASLGSAIITGHFYAGLLGKAVVMDEVNSPAPDLFVPFVHYIPIANVTEAVTYARFFLENEEDRQAVAAAGCEFFKQHYSAEIIWGAILTALK